MSRDVPPHLENRYAAAAAALDAGNAQAAVQAADALLGELIGESGEGSWEAGYGLWRLAQFLIAASQAEGLEACLTGAVERFRQFPSRAPATRLQALDTLAHVYASVERNAPAIAIMREALDVQRALGGEAASADVAERLLMLGALELGTNQFADAEAHLRELLASWPEGAGDAADRLSGLSAQFRHLSMPAAAEVPMRLAIEARKRTLGATHPDVARDLNFLAIIHEEQRDYAGAIPILEEALAIRRTIAPADDTEIVRVLTNLGAQHVALGQQREARPFFAEALAIRERVLGVEHPGVAETLGYLAGTYLNAGEPAAAAPLYARALGIQRKALGDDSAEVAAALRNVMGSFMEAGDYASPIPYAELDLQIARRRFGDRSAEAARALDTLSSMCFHSGRLDDAARYSQEVLDIRREVLGDLDPLVAQTLDNIQRIALAASQWAAMVPALDLELEIRRQTVGEEHPDFADTLGKLAYASFALGDHNAAQPLFQRTLAIQTASRGGGEQVAALQGLAAVHVAKGNHAAALPLLQHALEIQRKTLAESDSALGDSLAILAATQQALGLYADAEASLRETLAIRRAAQSMTAATTAAASHTGAGAARVADTLADLGDVVRGRGALSDAMPIYEEALALRRIDPGAPHPLVARLLASIAELHAALGHIDTAGTIGREALAMRQQTLGPEHPACADSLNSLAFIAREQGDLAAAASLYDQALAILSKPGSGEEAYATTLNNRGGLRRVLGRFADAESDYAQALAVRRRLLGPRHPEVATTLSNLGLLYEQWGRFRAADQCFRDAIDILRAVFPKGHVNLARAQANLASLLHEINDDEAAEPLFAAAAESIRQTLGDTHPDYATSLMNLAQVREGNGNIASALALYQQAFGILSAEGATRHPSFAVSLNALASLHQRAGLHDVAVHLLENAATAIAARSGTETLEYATIQQNLANVHATMGDHEAADRIYREAIARLRAVLGNTHPTVATALLNLAKSCAARGREVEALQLVRDVSAIHDQTMAQVLAIASERQRLSYLDMLRGTQALLLSLPLRFPSLGMDAVTTAFDLVLRRKAIGVEALAAQRDAILSGRYPELRERLDALATLRIQIGRKTLDGPGPEGREAHDRILAEWNDQRQREESALARAIPEMQLEHLLRAAQRADVAAQLPAGSVLVEFVQCRVYDFTAVPSRGEEEWKAARYLAFVMQAGGGDALRLIDLGDSAPIDESIVMLRRSLGDEELPPEQGTLADLEQTAAEALRSTLVDPLVAALDGRDRLFIAPDGDLALLPFEILPGRDGECLIDRYRISYVGVGREILRFGAPAPASPSAAPFVLADPDFDLESAAAVAVAPAAPAEAASPALQDTDVRQSRDYRAGVGRFERLPGTRAEANVVAKALGTRPVVGAAALEATLKGCRSPSVLHLATHGFFLPDQPTRDPDTTGHTRLSGATLENPLLRSGLALAGANTWLAGHALPREAEDGILNAEDVSALDLTGTSLVVLSACETGLGAVRVGEGVFGLRRVFAVAGARTLVMSLWKVPDALTQALMIDFYRRLARGESRADALRGAQLALKTVYPDRFSWGAFICQGEPGCITI
jgi:tetratricopeptide (TPR) repeat protein/CHAT domain-containing protein